MFHYLFIYPQSNVHDVPYDILALWVDCHFTQRLSALQIVTTTNYFLQVRGYNVIETLQSLELIAQLWIYRIYSFHIILRYINSRN